MKRVSPVAGRAASSQGGFTLVEVMLALIVSAIMIATAVEFYSAVKASALRSKQQNEVMVFKSMVEQLKSSAQAAGSDDYPLSATQLATFVQRVPAFGQDPYTSIKRAACTAPPACPTGPIYASYGPVASAGISLTTVTDAISSLSLVSSLIYLYGQTSQTPFTVNTVDGVQATYYGYVIVESDSNGKITGVAGGGTRDG